MTEKILLSIGNSFSQDAHRYHAQLFPDRLLYLVFESEGEKVVLALDADETFAEALRTCLSQDV